MPITLRGMCTALVTSLMCNVLLFSSAAEACRFTMQRAIKFEPEACTLSNADRVELAKTLIDVNNSAARRGMVIIYAYTEEGQGSAITKRRVESVIQYLDTLHVARDRINIDYEVWRVASNVPDSERFQIMVEFLPGIGENVCP
jgi:hypothetical protein